MTRIKPLMLALLLAAPLPVLANPEIEKLRGEFEQKLKALQDSYETRLKEMEGRMSKTESQAQAAQTSADAAARAPATASSFNPEVSLILQGQYAHLEDRDHRHISGFLESGGGHGHGAMPRGFSINHTELVMSASIDPYFRGYAAFALEDDAVAVEEAWFQTTALGHGLGVKGGRFRSDIGYLNTQHPHAWDFVDNPLIYKGLFGEALTLDGVQAKWVAPTDLFLEFGAEAARGLAEYNDNGIGAYTIFSHLGGDVGASHSWRAGLSAGRLSTHNRENDIGQRSGGHAETAFSGRTRFAGADFVWKWAPNGNPKERNFKFQSEYYKRWEKGALQCFDPNDTAVDSCDSDPTGALDTAQSGWYAQGIYQFMPRWRAGARYDRISLGSIDYGDLNASLRRPRGFTPERTSLMLDYSPSEFSRLRLQVSRDESSLKGPENQYFLQYIHSLGSHGAHKF